MNSAVKSIWDLTRSCLL